MHPRRKHTQLQLGSEYQTGTGTSQGSGGSSTSPPSGPTVSGTPQKPASPKPCALSTRIAGAVQAVHGGDFAQMAFTAASAHVVAGVTLVSAGCLDFPVDLLTCGAAAFGGVSTSIAASGLFTLGVVEVKNDVIPGVEQAVTCKVK